MTFAQWAADPTQDRIVLAEVQPAEQLGAFTLQSGVVYKVTWLKYVQASVAAGGLYRRLDSVRENGTSYSSQTSIANCQANAGSYFYDSANDIIYVHTSDGTTPNAFAFIGAWFTIFLSTKEPHFTDGSPIYEPRLTGVPQVRGEKPDELFGATIWSDGNLQVANGDKLFDVLSRSWIWENKKVTLKVGGTALVYSSYATLGTMRVMTVNVSDDVLVIAVQSMANILNRSVPPHNVGSILSTLAFAGYKLANDASATSVLAQPAPIPMGTVKDCPFVPLTDDGVSTADYLMLDTSVVNTLAFTFPIVQLTAVYAVNRATGVRTTLNAANDIADTTGTGVYTMTGAGPNNYASYRYNLGYDLRADMTVFTSPPWDATKPGTMAYWLLKMCGEDDANIDTASFQSLDSTTGYVVGAYLDTSQPASDVMRNIEQSTLSQVYVSAAGLWTCRLLNPLATAVAALVDQDFATWDASVEDQSVLSEVRVQYGASAATGAASEVSRSLSAVQYGRETTDSTRLATYLYYAVDAQEVCDRYFALRSRTRALITSKQRTLDLIAAQPGDLVTLTRSRAPTSSGAYAADTAMLRAVTVTLGGDAEVEVKLDDLARWFYAIGVYADDTGYAWSTATAAQKLSLCFYSDDNGYIDGTDVATLNRKVYW